VKLAKLNGRPEIFYSIQGEGKSIGRPAIFIRLSLCNLHCIWCDTDYTWNWENTPFAHVKDNKKGYSKYNKENWIVDLSIEQIIEELKAYPCKRVILTGGEPLMQQKELIDLAKQLKGLNYTIEVETNGTYIPIKELDQYIDQYNVSAKLENSNNSKRLREKAEAYNYFNANSKATFKFVIDTPLDLEEVESLTTKYDISADKVYLMPQGTSDEQLKSKQQWLIEACKSSGYNYTDRLHILVYGDKRGV
jgi:7-carboxy-7-deazaguanine synthase